MEDRSEGKDRSPIMGVVAGALGGMVGMVVTHAFHHATVRGSKATGVQLVFGALSGGMYGLLAEYLPAAATGFGVAFGASLLLGGSDALLPEVEHEAGHSLSPQVQTARVLCHAVYGATTEGVRRALR